MTEEEIAKLSAIADPFIGQLLVHEAVLAALVASSPKAAEIRAVIDGLIDRWDERFPHHSGAADGAKASRDRILNRPPA